MKILLCSLQVHAVAILVFVHVAGMEVIQSAAFVTTSPAGVKILALMICKCVYCYVVGHRAVELQ